MRLLTQIVSKFISLFSKKKDTPFDHPIPKNTATKPIPKRNYPQPNKKAHQPNVMSRNIINMNKTVSRSGKK